MVHQHFSHENWNFGEVPGLFSETQMEISAAEGITGTSPGFNLEKC
jgi:hypothetical protein